MKIITTLLFLVSTLNVFASEKCDKVVPGFEAKDTMYVICEDLSSLSQAKASELITNLVKQYKGPPDEIIIYFVTTEDSVGKSNLKGSELAGVYYTHSHKLEIRPNSKKNKRTIEIKRK